MAKQRFNFDKINEVLAGSSGKIESGESREPAQSIETGEKTEIQAPVMDLVERISRANDYKKAFDCRLVPRHKIEFHKKNDYPMEAIEQLASEILEFGIIEPLEVFYDEDNDSYIVESGEQRTRAIDLLIETYGSLEEVDSREYRLYWENVKQFAIEGYPCNVKRKRKRDGIDTETESLLEEIDSEVRLILANESGRAKNTERTRKHVERLNYLYTERNKLLVPGERINVNERIGSQLGITERQVIKYKAVSKLIPELQELLEKKGISLNEGESYSKLSEAEQRQLLALFETGENKSEINALSERLRNSQKEVAEKEKELKRLEQEKQEAVRATEDARKEAADLEEKIKQEMERKVQERGATDKRQIEELQNQLNTAQQDAKRFQKQKEQLETEQERVVAELELKLAAKDKQALIVPTKIARTALKMEGLLDSIEAILGQFQKTEEEYQGIYQDGAEELSPAEYRERLEKLVMASISKESKA